MHIIILTNNNLDNITSINVSGAVIYAADGGRKSGKMWEISGA